MNKQEIMTHIREELTEKENAVFDSMLNGDSVSKTAEKLGISYEFARSYRKTVYEVAGIYADLGNTNRNKQLRLIDLFSDNKTAGNNKSRRNRCSGYGYNRTDKTEFSSAQSIQTLSE